MNHILSFIKARKIFFIPLFAIILFFVARTILLQKPNTELTYMVKQEDLVDTVQVSGTYTTASQIQVTSPTNGTISELYVENGQEVKKGDPLFHVQSSATQDQQNAAYANYLLAKTTINADTAKLNTLQSLMFQANQTFVKDKGIQNPSDSDKADPKYIEENADWLAAEANYKNQQGIIAQDQATLANAYLLYSETQSTTVIAPANGTIVNLLVNTGNQVTAPLPTTAQTSSLTTQVQPVLLIANLGNPYITADISEDYAARVNVGQKAEIVFDAMKDKTFQGVVTNIATVGTANQGIVTYSARIKANDLPDVIKPNMTALITIETLRRDNVIDVPNSAVIMKNGMNYVEQAKSHTLLPISIGIKGVTKTEVTNGLPSGTLIVTNPD